MKCSILGKDAPAERLRQTAEVLASGEGSKDRPGLLEAALKAVKTAASGDSAARVAAVVGEKGKVEAACLFNACIGLGGPYLWIAEFRAGSAEHAVALSEQLAAWAQEHGAGYIAAAVEPSENVLRKAAKAQGMEERPVLWLERHLQKP